MKAVGAVAKRELHSESARCARRRRTTHLPLLGWEGAQEQVGCSRPSHSVWACPHFLCPKAAICTISFIAYVFIVIVCVYDARSQGAVRPPPSQRCYLVAWAAASRILALGRSSCLPALQDCCAFVWCKCPACQHFMHIRIAMHPMQRLGDDEKRCRSVSVTIHTIISLQSFLMPTPSMTHGCSIDCTLVWFNMHARVT